MKTKFQVGDRVCLRWSYLPGLVLAEHATTTHRRLWILFSDGCVDHFSESSLEVWP